VIKIKHLDTCGWMHAMRGLRNPLNSHEKSDSFFEGLSLGKNDLKLCKKLVKAGPSHRKFLRQINIYCDITANEKWFAEFDTYLHTVQNSTSQMHNLLKKEFELSDFSNELTNSLSIEHLEDTIIVLNSLREMYINPQNFDVEYSIKDIWRDIIELLPQSYLYTRTVMFNYEVFLSMYFLRKDHKMSEWKELMGILRRDLPYMDEFITVLEEKKK